MKVVGPRRGALLLGFIGGFMSSTAVTLTAAQAVRSRPDTATIFAAATCAAQAVMFLRTALLVTVLNASLAPLIAAPAIAGAVTAAAVAVFLFLRADRKIESSELAVGSPDQLATAFAFIAIVIVALLVGHYAQIYAGDFGMIASALIAGSVDVDAATVSVSTISGTVSGAEVIGHAPAAAIVAALAANSIVKVAIAFVRGNGALGQRAAIGLLGSALAAIAALIVQELLYA